jgi:hypothetical protein
MTEITSLPELVQQWTSEFFGAPVFPPDVSFIIATRAAQWGADQELEACCEWLESAVAADLRAARRRKLQSLKEQSLALLDLIQGGKKPWQLEDLDVVRRALGQLDD